MWAQGDGSRSSGAAAPRMESPAAGGTARPCSPSPARPFHHPREPLLPAGQELQSRQISVSGKKGTFQAGKPSSLHRGGKEKTAFCGAQKRGGCRAGSVPASVPTAMPQPPKIPGTRKLPHPGANPGTIPGVSWCVLRHGRWPGTRVTASQSHYGWEKTSKIIKSNRHPNTTTPAKPHPKVPRLQVCMPQTGDKAASFLPGQEGQ